MQMPRHYLVDLHHVGRARQGTCPGTRRHRRRLRPGGAAGDPGTVWLHGRILGFALLAATALMFVGALFVARRRLDPPSRLSKSPPPDAPAEEPAGVRRELFCHPCRWPGSCRKAGGWFLAGLLALGVAWGVSRAVRHDLGGPMKHALAGALHLA